MIGSIDSLQRPQYVARGSVKVTVEDNGPGKHACIRALLISLIELYSQG